MRQPEVARLTTLALAALLVVPVARAAWTLLATVAFLVELLSAGTVRPLSALTPTPTRDTLAVPGAAVDRWAPRTPLPATPLVLVHGLAAEGKDDPRVREAAALLARAGFDVAVPTIPGLTRGRLRPDDVAPVVRTLAGRAEPAVVLAVSVGAGPALLAAADPGVRDRVRAVLCLGGYASAAELLRFYLTGDFAFDDVRGHVDHDPDTVRAFVDANADLVDDATRAALAAGDRAHISRLLAAPPPALRALLDALSPARVVGAIPGRVVLVHGRSDRAVPYTETLRLAAARTAPTRVALVGVLDHVEGAGARATWRTVREFTALVSIMYEMAAGR